MARIMDVANRMGDGKSMGYDVVAVVVELLLAPSSSLLAISDVGGDDDTAADTFPPNSPSFANRCEDGSGGNPTTTSLFSLSSLVLARNTTCTLVELTNDLVVDDVVVGNGERLKLKGNLIADVDADADVAALFTTIEDVHVNASTEDEKSEKMTTATAIDDAADFMVAVLNTFVMFMVIIVIVVVVVVVIVVYDLAKVWRTEEICSTSSSDHKIFLGDAKIQETQYLGDPYSRHFCLFDFSSPPQPGRPRTLETRTSNHDGHHGNGVVVVPPEHHPEHQRPR
jgi:hypothetical protein